jgi:Na+-transporting methylmalonyl-CoA/oxaloacetate decarboxylase gamma subunit
MAIVFALLMPLTVIMYIDILAIRETVKAEARELRKLKEELRPKKKEATDE